jgi:acetylornithine deacetylase/succinyl-diaminopimelate desuccinylase-like protein
VSDHIVDWEQVKLEASALLSCYIQVNTVNPPGNELKGAFFLRNILLKEGFEVDITESVTGRGNLVSRLKGTEHMTPLFLLHHIDVVPVEEDKWQYPPFSGLIQDGEIWGRGSLDCKSLGVMELMALVILKRQGFKPKRDVILLATADEEAGGKWGIEWMIRNRPDLFRGGAVINEGGGPGLTTRKGKLYFCQTAEKGVCWLRLRFTGVPGHASIPHGHNCVVQMAQVIENLSRFHPPLQISEVVEKLVRRVAPEQEIMDPAEFLMLLSPDNHDRVLGKIPGENFRNLLSALLHNTFVPTVVKGGSKSNVIPSECYCEIDCRMLPGNSPEDIVRTVKGCAGGIEGLEIEIIDSSVPSASPLDHELYHLLSRAMKKYDPQAELVPYMSTGASDSRYFREMGMAAYGIQTDITPGALERMHGHNERISTESLLFGIQVFHEVVKEFCG